MWISRVLSLRLFESHQDLGILVDNLLKFQSRIDVILN